MLTDEEKNAAFTALQAMLFQAGPNGMALHNIQAWARRQTPVTPADIDHLLNAGIDAIGNDRLFVRYEPNSVGELTPRTVRFADIRVAEPTPGEVLQLVRAATTAGHREADIVEYLTGRYRTDAVNPELVRMWLDDAHRSGLLTVHGDRWYATKHAPAQGPVQIAWLRLPVPLPVYAGWLDLVRSGYAEKAPTTDHLRIEQRDGATAVVFYDQPVWQ